jgi:hypothetical protein
MPEPVGFVQNLALQSAMAIVNSPALVLQKVLLLWAARWSGVAMILAPYVLFRTHARERQRGIWRHIWTLYHKYGARAPTGAGECAHLRSLRALTSVAGPLVSARRVPCSRAAEHGER